MERAVGEIPRELRYLLAQRGGRERIIKELKARSLVKGRANVVFSTQQTATAKDNSVRNKGCMPCSNAIAPQNTFDNVTSGRTKFWSLDDGTILCDQAPRVRVHGETPRNI